MPAFGYSSNASDSSSILRTSSCLGPSTSCRRRASMCISISEYVSGTIPDSKFEPPKTNMSRFDRTGTRWRSAGSRTSTTTRTRQVCSVEWTSRAVNVTISPIEIGCKKIASSIPKAKTGSPFEKKVAAYCASFWASSVTKPPNNLP
eukprot:CAMPEP_0178725646 /NCGR_PEP_ID=MMETSP0699-20121125/26796_1 /TAXON_ID=265572 /ORGANISM="Extubocellulus spinifer, Strain CCMP396" /LENGTH=146 /DNA_ID=CAMNT_0020377017 /DNA_START=93 /DNA_END=533 /DNA_ORIENTATION=-